MKKRGEKMKREEIEAFQQRIMPLIEGGDDQKGLEVVCHMAAAFADIIERNVDRLTDSDVARWLQ